MRTIKSRTRGVGSEGPGKCKRASGEGKSRTGGGGWREGEPSVAR